MPLYDFQCSHKPHLKFERLLKSPSDPLKCPCGDRDCKPSRLLTAPAALHLKGPGFYQTDYKGK